MSDLLETIVGIAIIVAIGAFLVTLAKDSDSPKVVYEYETTSGETGEATRCEIYRNTYCILEDGTRVVNIKTYKRVEK